MSDARLVLVEDATGGRWMLVSPGLPPLVSAAVFVSRSAALADAMVAAVMTGLGYGEARVDEFGPCWQVTLAVVGRVRATALAGCRGDAEVLADRLPDALTHARLPVL